MNAEAISMESKVSDAATFRLPACFRLFFFFLVSIPLIIMCFFNSPRMRRPSWEDFKNYLTFNGGLVFVFPPSKFFPRIKEKNNSGEPQAKFVLLQNITTVAPRLAS